MLAALDVSSGRMYCRIRPRKRAGEFLDLLKVLRARWLGEKLYVVLDNFSPHRHLTVRRWAEDHDVELVFLPTYGSWLNWIESEFAALRYLRSTVPIIAAMPSRTLRSGRICGGAMLVRNRKPGSLPTHRSGRGPSTRITRPRLHDEALDENARAFVTGQTWRHSCTARPATGVLKSERPENVTSDAGRTGDPPIHRCR